MAQQTSETRNKRRTGAFLALPRKLQGAVFMYARDERASVCSELAHPGFKFLDKVKKNISLLASAQWHCKCAMALQSALAMWLFPVKHG